MFQLAGIGFVAVAIPPLLLAIGRAVDHDWLLPIGFFFVLPVLRGVFGSTGEKREEFSETAAKILLMLPTVYCAVVPAVLIWSFIDASRSIVSAGRAALFAFALAMGAALAQCVAHDLVHRRDAWSRRLAMLVSAVAGYPFFAFEHLAHHSFNRDEDAAHCPHSQENVYTYAVRRMMLVPGQAFEWSRVVQSNMKDAGVLDDIRTYIAMTACCALGALWVGGLKGLGWYVALIALVPFLLNVVTYVQHWGMGAESSPGLGPQDHVAWDEDCRLQRWLVLGLSAHNEHHWNPRRPYFMNAFVNGAPRLPAGYSVMVFVALIPPLWNRVMSRALEDWKRASTPTRDGGSAFCLRV